MPFSSLRAGMTTDSDAGRCRIRRHRWADRVRRRRRRWERFTMATLDRVSSDCAESSRRLSEGMPGAAGRRRRTIPDRDRDRADTRP